MAKIDEIDREEDLAFLLFHYANDVEGITRLQKLLFLLEAETDFADIYEDISFEFEPYKYGPFSERVYDALEFLIAIGAVEAVETDGDFDAIRDSEDQGPYAGKTFTLTEKGKKISHELNDILEDETKQEFEAVVAEYNDLSLHDLLEYVYRQHREYTIESEIKDEILK